MNHAVTDQSSLRDGRHGRSTAQHYNSGNLIAVRTIADEHQIPQQFLVQIFQQLRAPAGVITSIRGSSGGFRLSRPPVGITLSDIIDAVCPASPQSQATGASPVCEAVQSVWNELRQSQRSSHAEN
ncbi:MAG: Rrf2 family transcriptional regulator [Pirellulales bacterium]